MASTGLLNGTQINIANVDATASDTVTAGAGTTIDGGATFVIGPGRDIWLVYDLANTQWRAMANTKTALLGPNNLSDVSSAATTRTNLGLAIGTNVEAWSANLDAFSALTGAANKIPYYTGAGAMANAIVSGDCTNSAMALTCTKTNGAAFATSATTDTTNASNITSGTLPAARLPAALSTTTITHSQQEIDTSYTYNTPTTGQTVTLASGTETAIINPSGTLATLTVTLPACNSGYDGSIARISSTQIVTTLTVNATSGSVVGGPTSLAVGSGSGYLCRGANTTWYRIY